MLGHGRRVMSYEFPLYFVVRLVDRTSFWGFGFQYWHDRGRSAHID
jgi:hypothetical protein